MRKFKDLDCILLVDDDPFINLVHTKMVERAELGVSVKALTSVNEALAFLTRTGAYQDASAMARPGIILLDINMPGLSGWDFMDLYRQLDDSYRVNVIVAMLTTSLNPDDQKRALADEYISDFLQKPLRPEMVIGLAERYFEVDE